MLEPAANRSRPRRRRWPWVALAAVVLSWLLLVEFGPTVAPRPAPTPEQVVAGRMTARQLRAGDQSGAGHGTVRVTNTDLDGIVALIGNATNVDRIDAEIAGGVVRGGASIRVLPGQWLNLGARIGPSASGFPPLSLSVGHLTLPPPVARPLVQLARVVLRMRGVVLPPLDQLVRRLTIADGAATADLVPPRGSGLVRELISLRGAQVDGAEVARIYCALAARELHDRSPDFAALVRRGFALPGRTSDPVAANRATFVAIAMMTVGRQVGDLAGTAKADSARCPAASGGLLLGRRTDLAMHWSLSAALGAVMGSDVSRAMGEWKELADSLPNGEGFSFVDLSADRSGLHVARHATNGDEALRMRARLAVVTEPQLLPIAALSAEEGLSEARFVSRYGSIKAAAYQAAIARIDRTLERTAID